MLGVSEYLNVRKVNMHLRKLISTARIVFHQITIHFDIRNQFHYNAHCANSIANAILWKNQIYVATQSFSEWITKHNWIFDWNIANTKSKTGMHIFKETTTLRLTILEAIPLTIFTYKSWPNAISSYMITNMKNKVTKSLPYTLAKPLGVLKLNGCHAAALMRTNPVTWPHGWNQHFNV